MNPAHRAHCDDDRCAERCHGHCRGGADIGIGTAAGHAATPVGSAHQVHQRHRQLGHRHPMLLGHPAQLGEGVLVADLGGSRHLDPGALALDADLTVPDPGPDTGLATMASIHQAIGVLIDHGFSPPDAAGELHRRALYTGTSRHATATRLLGDVHPRPGIRSR